MVARVDVVTHDEESGTVLVLPDDNKLLEDTIIAHDVPVIIIDPLMSTVDSSLDTHKTREVRQALDPLNAMGERVNCLVLGIAHFNKASSSDVPNLITGSGAFRDVPRALLGFARDDKQRVMTQVKNSLGRDDLPSLEYRIDTAAVETPTGRATVGKFVFVGPTETTVQDLLTEARDGNRSAGKVAQEWASEYLADPKRTARYEAKSTDLYAAAEKNELSERTVRRALNKIGAHPTRKEFGGQVVWLHPTHPDHPDNQSGRQSGHGPASRESGQTESETGPTDAAPSSQPEQPGHSPANPETGQIVAGLEEADGADTPPSTCRDCGKPIFLRRPGRDLCERCRIDRERGSTE
jgi:AAA domain